MNSKRNVLVNVYKYGKILKGNSAENLQQGKYPLGNYADAFI